MTRVRIRAAKPGDLDLLVRHRRRMWEAIRDFPEDELDVADRVYRGWARARMKSGRLVGFVVQVDGTVVSSGCVWLTDVQPRPGRKGTTAAYLLSMFTEPGYRRQGHAARIVRAAIRWAKDLGIPTLVLHASRDGEPLYRGLGFERTREMRRHLERTRPSRVMARKRSRRRS